MKRASSTALVGACVAAVAASALSACATRSEAAGAPCSIDPGIDPVTCATLLQMALPASLPPSPTNAHADDYAAALMGFNIFFDARFSSTHTVRCATCHAPETHFDDLKPVAMGIDAGVRNSPTTLDVARNKRPFFWDGRADVLWAPPILAMENPLEMGLTRLELAHTVAAYYADSYAAVFGALPDVSMLPAVGKPGDPSFDGMSAADQDVVNRLASNVGKSIEAYLRKLATGLSPFDRFLAGDATAMTPDQQLGMIVFVQAGCPSCHSGPLLTDGAFHNLGVPAAKGTAPDPGRFAGIALERAQILSPGSKYSDDPTPLDIADATPVDLGAFRTPSLRNVALTAPYMHNGTFATLGDAVDFVLKLTPQTLTPGDRAALLDFLTALNGDQPPAPWNNWPTTP
jgi:cytochrome c peroxidase